ncbi:MAG: ABC transporter permease [Aeriscardovia sp.]|nr:ABC transporter permease [Aeriscardovia sp.]
MSIKRLLRAPTSIIFDLVYPVLILILNAAAAGNHMVDGKAWINYFISEALAKGLIPMACIAFPIYVARQIENGSVTRLNYFGVKTRWLMLADLLAQTICATMGVAIAMIAGWIWFKLRAPGAGYFFAFILQIFYALFTLMVWGQVAGVLVRNTKGIVLVGIIETFFLLFCSGGAATLDILPKGVRIMAECFPISWVSYKMPAIWLGHSYWASKFLWISAIWLAAGLLILWFMSLAGNPFIRAVQKQKIRSMGKKGSAKAGVEAGR